MRRIQHNLYLFFTLKVLRGLSNVDGMQNGLCFTGQSATTFIYEFVEEFKGPHPGIAPIDGRPSAGLNHRPV